MLRQTPGGRIVHVHVDPADPIPVYRQIHAELRSAIADGRLPAGTSLPSTRALANDLGVSRSTVVMAYDQLRNEGWVEASAGAATRVSDRRPPAERPARPPLADRPPVADSEDIAGPISPMLSRRVRRQEALRVDARIRAPRRIRAFRCGNPALDLFPLATWGRLLARQWRGVRPAQLGYSDPFGVYELREAIAGYLAASRGVHCDPEQVMITAGSQQALDLVARVLLDPGDEVWIEDPGFPGLRGVLLGNDVRAVDVRVDDEGMRVEDARLRAPSARAAFVTPSSHMPLGVALSLPRRLALLDWAAHANAWIIEDDYASELRYSPRPLAPLQSLDLDGRVIYCGTFSKALLPALRLGYLIVPRALVRAFAVGRTYMDYHSPFLEQATLAAFIREGHFDRHVRRMRVVYGERQQHLLDALHRRLGDRVRVGEADAGLDLIAWLRPEDDAELISREAGILGMDVLTTGYFAASHKVPPGLLLNFASADEREIEEGVDALATAIEAADQRSEEHQLTA